MGVRNVLVEGVSGSGKTTVADELTRRGLRAIHGDRQLAYQGDPETGEPTDVPSHWHHLWDESAVRAVVDDRSESVTFFCGGFRNHAALLPLFDAVFVLEVDEQTLRRRLAGRGADEFGGEPEQLALVLRLHRTREDLPADAIRIDSTAPVGDVVDEILRHL